VVKLKGSDVYQLDWCADALSFFKNALKPYWKGSNERLLILTEDDPEIFSFYLHLLYNEPLSLRLLTCGKSKEDQDFHLDALYDESWELTND
jgi:hypothetical protein